MVYFIIFHFIYHITLALAARLAVKEFFPPFPRTHTLVALAFVVVVVVVVVVCPLGARNSLGKSLGPHNGVSQSIGNLVPLENGNTVAR